MSRDEEKAPDGGVEHVDTVTKNNYSDVDIDEEFSYKEQRKIIHRVDLRLVTICGLGYCISLMDRTNTSMAAIAGYGQRFSEQNGS
ncbi:hypothetical protein CISG_03372 [Coccidioides immitis RMSCC 3703]|uniref:Major facilitator superfamily (MFS) profile domain-containing protein n=1 Tax=Coccidioides immitis RMSCC 3703 TaxID=454286 RepID=A0A0J8QL39_COCIT|nr:hypothetical protein CISG_03372 [Coccidioides immitis RMSCC 3703]